MNSPAAYFSLYRSSLLTYLWVSFDIYFWVSRYEPASYLQPHIHIHISYTYHTYTLWQKRPTNMSKETCKYKLLHLGVSFNFNPKSQSRRCVGVFSMKLGQRDRENEINDWDLSTYISRPNDWDLSTCIAVWEREGGVTNICIWRTQ